MHDDEFYDEPSEFEAQVDEFKQSLLEAVKKEYVDEMERLRKENADLQEVKRNLDQIKREYENKKREFEFGREELKREVRRERLSTLMEDFQVVMYKTNATYVKPPKCDKCDDNRQIAYKTPLGKDAKESCDCNVSKTVYVPKEHYCSEFRLNRDGNSIGAWYKQVDDDGYTYNFSEFADTVYKEGMKFEDIDHRETFFKTKEECQRYCDWLNSKQYVDRSTVND